MNNTLEEGYDVVTTWARAHPDVKLAPLAISDLAMRIFDTIRAALDAKQPHCGHPIACINASPEGLTQCCAWCVSLDEARRQERERCLAVVDDAKATLQTAREIEMTERRMRPHDYSNTESC